MAHRRWTAADTKRACDMRVERKSIAAIAADLDRSEQSIMKLLHRAGCTDMHQWSAKDKLRAIRMRLAGTGNADIGAKLGRSAGAVAMMFSDLRKAGKEVPAVSKLGDAKVVAAKVKREVKAAQPQRKCLRCGGMFPSWGPGNRRCDGCAQSVAATGMSAWL